MKTSSQQTPKKKDPQTLLLVGPPGGGKTSLLLHLPKLCVIDVDLRLDGAEALLRRHKPTLTYAYITPAFKDDGSMRDKGEVWKAIKDATREAITSPDIEWIAIDGLSALNFHLIDHVTSAARKSTMEQSDWIPFRQELLQLLNSAKLSGKHYVLTAHEETTTDREGKIVKRNLLLDSKLREAVGGWFSNVWRCWVAPGPRGRSVFNVTTRPTGYDDLKSASPTIPYEWSVDPATNIQDTLLQHLS